MIYGHITPSHPKHSITLNNTSFGTQIIGTYEINKDSYRPISFIIVSQYHSIKEQVHLPLVCRRPGVKPETALHRPA